jgi:broad specificity phosphatase PhoE
MTELLIIRHGQTLPNKEGRAVGRTDAGLTDAGREEARILGEHLKESGIPHVIYSGPLRRQRQTAEELGAALGVEVFVREELTEANYGDYEGASLEVLRGIDYGYDAEAMRRAGGETPAQIEERTMRVFGEGIASGAGSLAFMTSALAGSIMAQALNGEERVKETARPLKTGDFHRFRVEGRSVGEIVVVSFEPNCLKPPMNV